MIEILFDEYLAAYIILGVFVIGIVFKIFSGLALKSLINQSDNLNAASKNILKQIKLKYESLKKLDMKIFNVSAFINKFLLKYKCLGISVKRMDSLSKAIDLLCLVLGVLAGAFAYLNYQEINHLVFYMAQGLVLSIIGYMIRSIIDIDRKWLLIEINLQDYLENNLSNKFITENIKTKEVIPEVLETDSKKVKELDIASKSEDQDSTDEGDIQNTVFNNRVIEEILKEYLI